MPAADPLAARDLAWLLDEGLLDKGLLTEGSFVDRSWDGRADWPEPFRLSPSERADLRTVLAGWPAGPGPWPVGPVGRRFESLVADWLSESSALRLLARNWPLRERGQTIGEADLLVEREGRRELWELACKWYLGVPGAGWVGPGLNDRLASKLERLARVQLPRVHHPGFVAHWGEDFTARACLAGWLIPPLTDAEPVPLGRRPPAAWVALDRLDGQRLGRLVETYRIEAWWWLAAGRWLRPADALDQPQRVCPPLALPGQPGFGSGSGPAGNEVEISRPTAFAGIGIGEDGGRRERLRLVLVPAGWAERAMVFAGSPASSAEFRV